MGAYAEKHSHGHMASLNFFWLSEPVLKMREKQQAANQLALERN